MTDIQDRVCKGCGITEEKMRLEACSDCAQRAGFGRKYCSTECTRAYYFAGEPEDDEDFDEDA
jgi:hypothetical protein